MSCWDFCCSFGDAHLLYHFPFSKPPFQYFQTMYPEKMIRERRTMKARAMPTKMSLTPEPAIWLERSISPYFLLLSFNLHTTWGPSFLVQFTLDGLTCISCVGKPSTGVVTLRGFGSLLMLWRRSSSSLGTVGMVTRRDCRRANVDFIRKWAFFGFQKSFYLFQTAFVAGWFVLILEFSLNSHSFSSNSV